MTEKFHLPVLSRREDCHINVLVDQNKTRARWLARNFGVQNVCTDYRDLLKFKIDAPIVALPNFLHAPVSIELFKARLHVFVEKPMALSVTECDAMIEAADKSNTLLVIGLHMRFSYGDRFAKWAIDNDLLGYIKSFKSQWGFVYVWPNVSDSLI